MVSRFLTAKEIAEVLQQTARGNVDVLIGTHRLLQKDVEFKDLGLVIITTKSIASVSSTRND